jgi:serine/threonine-protein kinase
MSTADPEHPSDAPTTLVDSTLGLGDGRFTVLGEIASGGMATIERIADRALERHAARKCLDPDALTDPNSLRRFIREARITSRLDHPNVVPVHDIGIDRNGRVYFTMKLVEGRTLSALIRERPQGEGAHHALLDRLDIVTKVCDALSLAHDRGVIHCDVKPDNVMVGEHGEVFLMDWGVARLLDESQTLGPRGERWDNTSILTNEVTAGTDRFLIGTVSYMAPEQTAQEGLTLSVRTDVFNVGATLYEVVTGRPPYEGETFFDALGLARACRFPVLEDDTAPYSVPPQLARIISKAMAREPGERYQSISDLRLDLIRFIRGEDVFPRATFAPGEVIVREGEGGHAAFIIEKGRCGVHRTVGGEMVVISELGPGEVFGETAILSPGPRTASVVAIDAVTVQVVNALTLERELSSMRPWMAMLIRTLASRFRELDSRQRSV